MFWYHFDVYCGPKYSGHIDLECTDRQLDMLRKIFFEFGYDLLFNEQFNPWTISELKTHCLSE